MKRIALLSLVTTSILMAGGYKIPETSLNAVALSAANIAHNKSADAAYYNPANMVFMEDSNHIEADLTYIGLSSVKYEGTVSGTGPYNLESESESFIVPSIHYVSGKAGETRIGLSITAPGGLSKRWSTEPAKTSAQEFTLEIVEVNPSVAFPINDKLAIAFGFRIVHTSGVVKSDGTTYSDIYSTYGNISRDMSGDSIDYGYNLALTYKPTSELELAATYRSQVNLTVDGEATLTESFSSSTYDGDASVTIPLPACFSIAAAYTLSTKTTLEFVYERTMWSAYENLDFSYDGTQSATLEYIFGTSIPKNWNDTNTFRLGVTQELDKMTLMAGMVYDETPTPEATVGFELPDSDSIGISFGGRYQINSQYDVGLAALYSMRADRVISNDNIDGEFTEGNVLIVSAGVSYKF
jgi:long-chain fatty acid transport protein